MAGEIEFKDEEGDTGEAASGESDDAGEETAIEKQLAAERRDMRNNLVRLAIKNVQKEKIVISQRRKAADEECRRKYDEGVKSANKEKGRIEQQLRDEQEARAVESKRAQGVNEELSKCKKEAADFKSTSESTKRQLDLKIEAERKMIEEKNTLSVELKRLRQELKTQVEERDTKLKVAMDVSLKSKDESKELKKQLESTISEKKEVVAKELHRKLR